MKYEEVPAVKSKVQYDVPKEFFDKYYMKYLATFPGYYKQSNVVIKAAAWRAFEIEYRRRKRESRDAWIADLDATVLPDTMSNPKRKDNRTVFKFDNGKNESDVVETNEENETDKVMTQEEIDNAINEIDQPAVESKPEKKKKK